MHATPFHTPTQALARAGVGDRLVIQQALFDVTREILATAGIAEGAAVHCTQVGDREVHLRTAAGGELAVDRFYARFVEVMRIDPPVNERGVSLSL